MCASLLGESGASKGRNLPHPNPCQIFKNAGGNERRNPLQINPSVLTYKGGRSCREASIMPCTFGSPRTCQDLALLHQHTHTHSCCNHCMITNHSPQNNKKGMGKLKSPLETRWWSSGTGLESLVRTQSTCSQPHSVCLLKTEVMGCCLWH